jgi:hypothetical protein
VPLACGALGDARPAADIALPTVVVSHSDHSAIGLNPNRVTVACGDLDDVFPATDIALPMVVVSPRVLRLLRRPQYRRS